MMSRLAVPTVMSIILFSACAPNNGDVWEDIDYAKIAHDNYVSENDVTYIAPPSVVGCVDDDLYNCKR